MFNEISLAIYGRLARLQGSLRREGGQSVLEYVMIAIALSIVAFVVYRTVGGKLVTWVETSIIKEVFGG
jgi:hypothetical protein